MDPNHDIVPTLRMFGGLMTGQAADEIERLRKRVSELSDLLTSAGAIAERKGDVTHWERFSERLRAIGIGSITPRTFRVLLSDRPHEMMTMPDVLISKLANLRAIATERHVPEVDLATIDLAIEHLRYFSATPAQPTAREQAFRKGVLAAISVVREHCGDSTIESHIVAALDALTVDP